MNDKKPKVSFVVPTHNRANLIKDCIDSLLRQTYDNIEIIIVNDNSSDTTTEILEEYSQNHVCLKYFNNDGKGVGAARNLGIKMATGEYIAFMDDDDICEPFRVEEQIKPIFESNFKYDFIINGFSIVNPANEVIKINNYLLKTNSIGFTVRWLVGRKLLLEVGGFDPNQPNLEEVELFFRLREKANIYFNPISVVRVREFPVSLTKNNEKMIKGINRLLDLHSKNMGWYEKNSWLLILSRKYLEEKNKNKFKQTFSLIDSGRFRAYRVVLILSDWLGTQYPIKIYGLVITKLESFINRNHKVYPVNIN